MDLRTELALLALYVYTPELPRNRPFLPNNWALVEPELRGQVFYCHISHTNLTPSLQSC